MPILFLIPFFLALHFTNSNVLESFLDLIDFNTCDDPDYHLKTHGLILSKGYPAANYTVTTPDNYVLRIHRIPNGNGYNGDNTRRKVLYLHHGLLGDSSNFVINFPNSSLGFMAYDRGYDVWMGNSRGNTYGRTNLNISPFEPRFWFFNWDEIAKYDIPTIVDFILEETSQEQVYYAGHSQGTTVIMALLSENVEYQKKIKVAALLNPSIYQFNVELPFFLTPEVSEPLLVLISTLSSGVAGNLFPNTVALRTFARTFCGTQSYQQACTDLLSMIIRDGKYSNKTRSCVYLSHGPSGASMYELQHFAQQTRSLGFQKYDYGFMRNYVEYGQSTPPKYDVYKVKIPLALISGAGDDLSTPKDVAELRKQLTTVDLDLYIDDPDFNHVDFILSPSAGTMVNQPLLDFFDKY